MALPKYATTMTTVNVKANDTLAFDVDLTNLNGTPADPTPYSIVAQVRSGSTLIEAFSTSEGSITAVAPVGPVAGRLEFRKAKEETSYGAGNYTLEIQFEIDDERYTFIEGTFSVHPDRNF